MKTTDHAWLFDVDGVITHLEKKENTQPKILQQIIRLLEKHDPVVLVTGRSIEWVQNKVVNLLTKKIHDKHILNYFAVIGDKGGSQLLFENGNVKKTIDKKLKVPKLLKKDIQKLIEDKFSKWMFLDTNKETMISIEMNDNIDVAEFLQHQNVLNKKLNRLLKKHNQTGKLKLIPVRIATDIQHVHIDKKFATQKVLEWIKLKNLDPKSFIAIGDDKQDIEMPQHLCEQNLPVTFVFVGDKELLDGKTYPFPIVYTKSLYEKGTLEYLTSSP